MRILVVEDDRLLNKMCIRDRHHAGYPDVYLASRKKLVVTIHAAAGDIRTCELLIFPRTSPEKISSYLMQRVTRDGVRDHFTAEVITEDTLRYLKYYFRLTDTAGKIYFQNAWETSENEPEDGFYEFLYANETNVLKVPEWAKGVIYYQIFPERFANGEDVYKRQNQIFTAVFFTSYGLQ